MKQQSSVAKVRFSPVLTPFFENRELNRQIFFGTEQNWNRTVQNQFYLFSSVPEPVRTGEPLKGTPQLPISLQVGSRVPKWWQKYINMYYVLLLIHFIYLLLMKHERERQKRSLLYSVGCAQTICTYLQWSCTFCLRVFDAPFTYLHIFVCHHIYKYLNISKFSTVGDDNK